jgi:molybdenum cofactor synthesis domain-containing protein
MRVAILTVSDKGSRGERPDTSGDAVAEMVLGSGGQVVARDIVPDERHAIAAKLREWCGRGAIDVILTTGGTGLSSRDVTPEATRDVAERDVPGMGEAMRAEGLRHTPRAMLSRAAVVVRGSTLILNLPGSEKGVRESLAAVIGVLPHAAELLRGETEHPKAAS